MDYKKVKAPSNTVTRDINELAAPTGNIYESVHIMARRADQISVEMKKEIKSKLDEFASYNDSLDEVYENREQIEISRFYEKLPKPSLIASQEFVDNQIHWHSRDHEQQRDIINSRYDR